MNGQLIRMRLAGDVRIGTNGVASWRVSWYAESADSLRLSPMTQMSPLGTVTLNVYGSDFVTPAGRLMYGSSSGTPLTVDLAERVAALHVVARQADDALDEVVVVGRARRAR